MFGQGNAMGKKVSQKETKDVILNEDSLGVDSLSKSIDQTPKSDVVFKILFGNPKHPRLLLHLLNSVVETSSPITHVDIRKTELTPEFLGQRGVRLDILAKTSEGCLINIELQKQDEHNMIHRSMFHWSKLFSGQAVVSERYEDLKRTVCINILNFSLFKDNRFWHKHFVTDSETNERLTDLLELHFLELPKVRKLPTESPIMFWLEFINDPDSKKIEHMYGTESVYQEARVAYHRAVADPEVQELLRIRDKAEKDYSDALARRQEKGEKIGAERERRKAEKEKRALIEKAKAEKEQLVEKAKAEKIESAKKMISKGLSAEDISDFTGLSLEEVKKL